MMKFAFLSLLSLGISLSSIAQQSDPHTRVQLLADVESVQPGTFMLGLLMSMDPGWHTYWKNPGDAGLATRIKWQIPAGVSVGEIQWPAPHKYIEAGEILTFGYEVENMLLIPVRIDQSVALGSIEIKASADWLECERVCIPGSGEARLTLKVFAHQPLPAHKKLFDKYKKQIPQSSDSRVVISAEVKSGTVRLHVDPAVSAALATDDHVLPDFFPGPSDELKTGRTQRSLQGSGAAVEFSVSPLEQIAGDQVLRGILVYQLEGGDRSAVEYSIPLPAGFFAQTGENSGGASILDRRFETVTQSTEGSILLFMFFAVVGGLLLNIMPCVLPVIALKIFGLVKMGGDSPAKIRRLGWMFSLGVLVSFLSLAVIVILLKIAGENVGWGFQFQEPAFVVAMCAIVFVFGLNLFGVFEIRLPSMTTAGVGRIVQEKESTGAGSSASFWEGVFATILATPCTAPFLGTSLGFAFSQPWWIILLIFACVAFGMSLPYLLLTARPAWTRYLPKPGEWMVTVKQFMGFLMMATLVWLLYVLGKQLGMEAVIWASAFLLMTGVAFWLIGKFANLTATRKTIAVTWSTAILLVVAGYLAFLQPMFEAQQAVAGQPPSNSADGIQWKSFSLATLENALQQGQPVFIDFTAEWCLTCKVNEKTVLADDAVIKRFSSASVIPLKADWTNRNAEITSLLAKFGRSGVPLYVVFPAGKPNAPIILPEVITADIVIEALNQAAQPAVSSN